MKIKVITNFLNHTIMETDFFFLIEFTTHLKNLREYRAIPCFC